MQSPMKFHSQGIPHYKRTGPRAHRQHTSGTTHSGEGLREQVRREGRRDGHTCVLRVVRCVLRGVCCVLCAACCVLRAVCYVLTHPLSSLQAGIGAKLLARSQDLRGLATFAGGDGGGEGDTAGAYALPTPLDLNPRSMTSMTGRSSSSSSPTSSTGGGRSGSGRSPLSGSRSGNRSGNRRGDRSGGWAAWKAKTLTDAGSPVGPRYHVVGADRHVVVDGESNYLLPGQNSKYHNARQGEKAVGRGRRRMSALYGQNMNLMGHVRAGASSGGEASAALKWTGSLRASHYKAATPSNKKEFERMSLMNANTYSTRRSKSAPRGRPGARPRSAGHVRRAAVSEYSMPGEGGRGRYAEELHTVYKYSVSTRLTCVHAEK